MALAKLLTFGLLAASIEYWVLCIIGALKFLSRRPDERAEGAPPVTILKPLRGLDPDLADNCRAVCRQDYPVYQVIFGVADPQDPAIQLLQSVLAESPGGRHRLVIGPEVYGPNRKVSLLQQMLPSAAQEARRQGYRLLLRLIHRRRQAKIIPRHDQLRQRPTPPSKQDTRARSIHP